MIHSFSIPADSATSDVVILDGPPSYAQSGLPVGLIVHDAIYGGSAEPPVVSPIIEYHVSPDGATFYPLFSSELNQKIYTDAPSTVPVFIPLTPELYLGALKLRLVITDGYGATIVQPTVKSFGLVLRPR